ncbi:uncharacterized protein LOC132252190 [Alligator mississippiensis]|uniref:uncharacterized protein LOC132252190 n=1 Tax=Alligator mississippiensis TaxID=8496 RepID=UPI002877EAAB|nr:uncharacterized protein LOC132252190 [Alligator mississippiensis]
MYLLYHRPMHLPPMRQSCRESVPPGLPGGHDFSPRRWRWRGSAPPGGLAHSPGEQTAHLPTDDVPLSPHRHVHGPRGCTVGLEKQPGPGAGIPPQAGPAVQPSIPFPGLIFFTPGIHLVGSSVSNRSHPPPPGCEPVQLSLSSNAEVSSGALRNDRFSARGHELQPRGRRLQAAKGREFSPVPPQWERSPAQADVRGLETGLRDPAQKAFPPPLHMPVCTRVCMHVCLPASLSSAFQCSFLLTHVSLRSHQNISRARALAQGTSSTLMRKAGRATSCPTGHMEKHTTDFKT